MAELERAEASIHYETWGESGAWLTLINGHNRPLNDFRMMGRFLVDKGYRVLVLDNRGAGSTRSPAGFTLADMQADVAALWQHVGITRTALLGISMGGLIAQGLAAANAAVVRSLVLVSTTSQASRIAPDKLPWSADPAACEAKLLPYFTKGFAARNQLLVRSMAKQIAKSVAEGDFLANSAAQRQAIGSFALGEMAGLIRTPTLIIHGAEDAVIPLAAAEETLAALQSGGNTAARLVVIPEVGHLLLAECPKELYSLVAEAVAQAS